MKFLGLDKVLCLAPHPDDIELGMLGAICKYKNTHFDIFVLSEGGDFDETTKKERHDECLKALRHIDNVTYSFADEKFMKNKAEDEWIHIIENKYKMDEYECIFVPPFEDSHFDHRFVNQMAPALVRSSKCGVITYKTPSTLNTWLPNLFVDLNVQVIREVEDGHSSDTHKTFLAFVRYIKEKRLEDFVSQQNKTYFKSDSIESFHSNFTCSKRGMNFVESFRVETTYV